MSLHEQIYSIKDLEDISGIKSHTLRAWERRYNIFTPNRTETNIRRYSDEDLKKLLNISVLQKYGLKISQLALLSEDDLKEKVISLTTSNDFESIIDSLTVDMIDFNQNSFDKKLNKVIFNLGFEEAAYKVIYPFFYKVGLLWQTSSINPAQEHFVTSIIIQKLFLAIESLDTAPPKGKTFLLFLSKNEWHEVGLLLANYIIRKAGHKVIYLGQNMPMTDIIKTCHVTKPDYLFSHFTSKIEEKEILNYLKDLAENIGKSTLLVAGNPIPPESILNMSNVEFLGGPSDLAERVKNL